MSSGRYMAYSPSPSAPHSPHIGAAGGVGVMRAAASVLMEQEKYLSELLSERNKIIPFVAVLPNSYCLLNQEIFRVTTLLENASVLDQNGLEQASPLSSAGMFTNGGVNYQRLSPFQSEVPGLMQPPSTHNRLGFHGCLSGLIVKKLLRIDVPVEQHPNFNFVGRLLDPRGNSLKRVEAATGCRVLIRGCGSVKDPEMEAAVRGKPGYEHLNEPLHVLIEAEMPVEIIDARIRQAREIIEDLIKHTDESHVHFKQQQQQQQSGSVSPFNTTLGMKRAKIVG